MLLLLPVALLLVLLPAPAKVTKAAEVVPMAAVPMLPAAAGLLLGLEHC